MSESPNPDESLETMETPENPWAETDAAPTAAGEFRPCPNCGKEMRRNTARCSNCGATLPPDPTLQGPAAPEDVPLLTKSVWGDRITGAIAALILTCIPLGMLALPLLYFLVLRKRYPIFAFAFGVVSLGVWILIGGAFVVCIGLVFFGGFFGAVGGGKWF